MRQQIKDAVSRLSPQEKAETSVIIEKRIEWLPLFAEAGITPKTVGLVGNAGDEIAAFAQNEGLDLVVMGSHGYGRIKSAVMGSTATRIASRGTVPLLVTQVADDTDSQQGA